MKSRADVIWPARRLCGYCIRNCAARRRHSSSRRYGLITFASAVAALIGTLNPMYGAAFIANSQKFPADPSR
jgi:hypothetical protein